MPTGRWTREQLVLTFALYCQTPFGRMHQHNPDIVALANAIGRTPSAVAMKMSNFASLDPAEQASGIRGLSGAAELDRAIFAEFSTRQDHLVEACEQASQQFDGAAAVLDQSPTAIELDDPIPFAGPTEVQRTVMVRRAQRAFRRAVMASYDTRCAICEISLGELLIASHIIPWTADEDRRADPTNGLSLCALHDRAFDRGLITADESHRVLVSRRAIMDEAPPLHRVGLIDIAGHPLRLPARFHPDPVALAYHRSNVFAA